MSNTQEQPQGSFDNNNKAGSAAPLYITIGPPCSGKTTWLRNQTETSESQANALKDVSLDDQPYVYVPIPLEVFCLSSSDMKSPDLSREHQELLERSYFMKTVKERILADDQQELRWILQRLTGKLSADQFEACLRSQLPAKYKEGVVVETKESREAELVANTLLQSMESLLKNNSDSLELPEKANLFILEALFQKDPALLDRWTGIERATHLLRQTPKSRPLAWGNTNTKARDYANALQVAVEQGRPVTFCVYGDNRQYDLEEPLFDLPKLEFRQLVDRNLQRLIQSGQYIPCKVLFWNSARVEKLIGDAIRNCGSGSGTTPTKLELDRQLARLANFDLQEDRRPIRMQRNNHNHNGRSSNHWQKQIHSNRRSQGETPWGSNRRQYPEGSQHRPGRGHPSHNQYRQHKKNFNMPDDPLDLGRENRQHNNRARMQGNYAPPPHGNKYRNRQPSRHARHEERQGTNGYDANYPTRSEPSSSWGAARGHDQYKNPQQHQQHQDPNRQQRQEQRRQQQLEQWGTRAPRNHRETHKRPREEADDPWADVGDASRFPREQQQQHQRDTKSTRGDIHQNFHG